MKTDLLACRHRRQQTAGSPMPVMSVPEKGGEFGLKARRELIPISKRLIPSISGSKAPLQLASRCLCPL